MRLAIALRKIKMGNTKSALGLGRRNAAATAAEEAYRSDSRSAERIELGPSYKISKFSGGIPNPETHHHHQHGRARIQPDVRLKTVEFLRSEGSLYIPSINDR